MQSRERHHGQAHIEESKPTFPEAGREANGSVPAKLDFLDKVSNVAVEADGGTYTVKTAAIYFDDRNHVADNRQACSY